MESTAGRRIGWRGNITQHASFDATAARIGRWHGGEQPSRIGVLGLGEQ
jgi:hypothetical protein